MGRRGTAAAESFALLMQGIAQGIHGLRQKQAQESDDARAERRLQMEEEHFRQSIAERRQAHADLQQQRQDALSQFADRMASDQEDRALRKRSLDLTEQQHQWMNEDRDLARQERGRHNLEQERLRQEAIDKARKEDRDLREMEYVLGAEKGGSSAAERGPYMDFRDLTEPLRAKGLDDKAILDALQKPGNYTFQYDPNDTVMASRLALLNQQRKKLGQPEITPTGNELTLSHSGIQALRATTDVLSDWGASNKELDKIMERTRPPIENLGGKGIRPERLMGMLQRKRQWDEVQGGRQQAAAPVDAGVPELREAQNRDGNLIRNRTDRMVGALLGGEMGGMEGQVPSGPMATMAQLAGVFSTDPMQRLTNWMELHTAGYPLMPPTLDMAVDAATGVPQLKPEYFAMMEQTQPGMGQAMNQMLQSMASVQQRNQQQFGPQGAGRDEAGRSRGQGGYLQGQFPLGGSPGERAASRASQSRPAPTQASPMIPQGRTPQPGPFNPMFGVGR